MEIEFMEAAIHLFGGEGWGRMDLAARKRVMNYLVDRFDIPLETKTITLPTPFNPTRSPLEEYIKGISPPTKIPYGAVPGTSWITPPTMLGDPNIRPNIQLNTDDICKDLEL